VVALLALLGLLGTALTPAGADVRHWIADRVSPEPSPTLSRLPAPGDLLVSSPAGTWVVRADGGLRRLGGYTDSGWSPRGLYVAGTRGRRLYAVEPDGTVHWSIVRPGRVSRPSWSHGLGYRVAYLEGSAVRVVAGDGTADRPVGRGAAAVTPDWRPVSGNVLSWATRDGRVVTRDLDAGRTRWSLGAGGSVRDLEWTGDGSRLVVLLARAVRVIGPAGTPLATIPLPAGTSGRALSLHPGGRSAAVAGDAGGVVSVQLAGGATRRLFDGGGRFSGVAWSPDGRWLLASWRDADQWVFIHSPGARRGAPDARRVVTFSQIERQLDPGGEEEGFPELGGWCCA
jgi:sugar lactone lactonase YvrE